MRPEKGEMALLFVAVLVGCSAVHAQTGVTFSRVTMEPHQDKRLDFVLSVADLNADGRDDVVAGGREEYTFEGTREDRFTKTELHVFVGEEDGSLTYAPELVDGPMEARNPFVVTNDFNGDDIPDLAIFDRGVYVGEESLGYGNPPQLFVSCDDGVLRPTSALEDAVRREHELFPHPRYSGADLHIKVATSGDIDGDGDIDLWAVIRRTAARKHRRCQRQQSFHGEQRGRDVHDRNGSRDRPSVAQRSARLLAARWVPFCGRGQRRRS